MSTLSVSATHNYSGDALSGIDTIEFTNTVGPAIATFAASQFNGTAISAQVMIVGSTQPNHIVVNGGSVDLSALTFSSWTAGVDQIVIDGNNNVDVLKGSTQNDIFRNLGGDGFREVRGGDGNDTIELRGSEGFAATLDGGAGTDELLVFGTVNLSGPTYGVEVMRFDDAADATYVGSPAVLNPTRITTVVGSAAKQTLNLFGGDLSGVTFINWTNGVDTITITSDGGNLIGSSQNDTIIGNQIIDDFIKGGGGADVLKGAGGNDLYVLGSEASGIDLIIDTGGTDTIQSTISRTLAFADYSEIENLTLLDGTDGTGNSLNNKITGNSLANTLSGGIGNDTLDGRTGADALDGGAGDDTYLLGGEATGIDTVSDVGGIDTITSTISRDLGFADFVEVENLILLNSAIAGSGNAKANTITGNTAANTLTGVGPAPDTLIGGRGSDTYNIRFGDSVLEAAGTLAGTADLVQFTGTVGQTYTLAIEVERLTLMGTAATSGIGNASKNTITGNVAANVLTAVGLTGDTLIGGNQNDTYNIVGLINAVVETATATSGAADRVNWTGSAGQTLGLAANVELLFLMGTAATNATGNAVVNVITGNGAANILTAAGTGNVDTLKGLGGNDTYVIDASADRVQETAGTAGGTADHVKWTGTAGQGYVLVASVELLTLLGAAATNGTGNADANTITGNSGGNVLKGGGGADILLPGAGRDFLQGQVGNDTFRFLIAGDSVVGANRDMIQDFENVSDNDVIDLSLMAGVNAFIGIAAFTAAGQVRAIQSGANVLVQINTAGAGGAESEILIANATLGAGVGQVDAGDFLL